MQPIVFQTADGQVVGGSGVVIAILPRPGDFISIGGTPNEPAHKFVVTDEPVRWHRHESKFVTHITVRPA